MSSETFSGRSGTRRRSVSRTGFSAREVQSFRNQGNTLSTQNNNIQAPEQRSSTVLFERDFEQSGIFGGFRSDTLATRQQRTGFLGNFADETQADIDNLLNSFNRRSAFIRDRRSRPGRSQLLFANR